MRGKRRPVLLGEVPFHTPSCVRPTGSVRPHTVPDPPAVEPTILQTFPP